MSQQKKLLKTLRNTFFFYKNIQYQFVLNRHPDWNEIEIEEELIRAWINLSEDKKKIYKKLKKKFQKHNEIQMNKLQQDQCLNIQLEKQFIQYGNKRKKLMNETSQDLYLFDRQKNMLDEQPQQLHLSESESDFQPTKQTQKQKNQQELLNIISSQILSNQKYEQQLQIQLKQLKQMNNSQLKLIFDEKTLNIFIENLLQCKSRSGITLFNIIEYAFNRIGQLININYERFIAKIEKLIYNNIQEDLQNVNKTFSKETRYLMEIYLIIQKQIIKPIQQQAISQFAYKLLNGVNDYNMTIFLMMQLDHEEFQKIVDLKFMRQIKQKFEIEFENDDEKGIYSIYKNTRQIVKKNQIKSKNERWEMIYCKENNTILEIEKKLYQQVQMNMKAGSPWLSSDMINQLAIIYNTKLNRKIEYLEDDPNGEYDHDEQEQKKEDLIENGIKFKQYLLDQFDYLLNMNKKLNSNRKRFNKKLMNLQSMIKCVSKEIESLNIFVDKYKEMDIDYKVKLFEAISLLYHINCAPEINCHNCIVFPTKDIKELKDVVFKFIADFSQNNSSFRRYLIRKHQIHLHLNSLISQFIASNLPNSDYIIIQCSNQIQQQQIDINSALKFIKILLDCHIEDFFSIIKSPNLPNSIVQLSIFNVSNYANKQQHEQATEIRNICNEIINYILKIDNKSHRYVSQSVFIRPLAVAVSSFNRNGEINNDDIGNVLDFIGSFFGKFLSRDKQPNINSQEQLEEEGSNEEIDFQLANQDINIINYAKIAKGYILHFFINKKNKRSHWYW